MPMFYSQAENKYVNEGTAFELGGVQYPANWLNLSTLEEKTAIGLVEVQVVGAPGDDRYYWVSETLADGVLTYTNTPKDLDTLKVSSKEQVVAAEYALLQPTDWIDLRNLRDPNYKVDWMLWRESIRTTGTNAVIAIEAATDIDSLIAACEIQWPNDPNYVAPAPEETV